TQRAYMDHFREKLDEIVSTYRELQEKLGEPGIVTNQELYQKLAKQLSAIQPTVDTYENYLRTEREMNDTQEILRTESDKDLREMAESELVELKKRFGNSEERLRMLLLPKDPNDEKDIIVEIRAGTGGDEASLFAGDLFRLYSKYADKLGWTTEVVTFNDGEVGGYKEIILNI